MGLRRVGPVLERDGLCLHAQLLRDRPHEARTRRRRRRRRADLPVGARQHRPELRPLESVRPERRDPGATQLPPGQRHPGRPPEPGDLQRVRQRRPQRVRLEDAVGERRHAGRVRHRVPARLARQQGRRAAGSGAAVGNRRRHHRHHRLDQGAGALLRGPPADRTGPGDGREPVDRHRVPLVGLRRQRHHRYLQAGHRVGAGLRHPVPRQLPACDPCRQHRRAVHRAGLQPVRREWRPLRQRGAERERDRRGVHRDGRAGRLLRRRQ